MNFEYLKLIRSLTDEQLIEIALRFLLEYPDSEILKKTKLGLPFNDNPTGSNKNASNAIKFKIAGLDYNFTSEDLIKMRFPTKIGAIKYIREKYNLGLREAKGVVEELANCDYLPKSHQGTGYDDIYMIS